MPTMLRISRAVGSSIVPLLALAIACGGGNGADSEKDRSASDAARPSPSPKPAPADAGAKAETPTEAGGKGDEAAPPEGDDAAPLIDVDAVLKDPKIGVKSCDDYVQTYLKCLEGDEAVAEREVHRARLAEQVASWKQTLAGAPSAEVALKIGCRTARESAKRATKTWSCRW